MSVPDPFAEFDAPSTDPFAEVAAPTADPFAEFDDLPVGSALDALTEPLTSMASSVAGASGAGVREMAGLATGEPLEEALQAGQEVQEAMDEFGRPITQVGAYSTAKVADLMEMGADIGNMSLGGVGALNELLMGEHDPEVANQIIKDVREKGVSEVFGDKEFEVTGSPWRTAMAKASPEILGLAIPVKQIWKHRGAQTMPEQELAQRIMEGDTSGELARYVVDGVGKLKYDPMAQLAVDAGLDQGFLSAVKALPEPEGVGVLAPEAKAGLPATQPPLNATKRKLLDMLDIKQKGYNDWDYRSTHRPSDVAGDSALERFNFVKERNKEAGKRIDEESEKLRDQYVDFSQPINNFKQALDSLDIKFNEDTGKLMFDKSDIAGLEAPKNAIKRMVRRLQLGNLGENPTAYDLHRLKRYIDESLGYGKLKEGLTGRTEHVVRQLRTDVDDLLDGNFPDYDKANVDYHDTIKVINEFQDIAGTKMDLGGVHADRDVGNLMRRIVSNAKSAGGVLTAVENLDDVARQYGGKFDDNMRMLVAFNGELEKIWGASGSGTFQGGIEQALSSTMNRMDSGRSMKRKAFDAVLRKLTPEQKESFDIIRKAIEGRSDPWRK